MPEIGLIGGAAPSVSRDFNSTTCVNLMVEKADPGAKGQGALVPTPGLSLWTSGLGEPIRGRKTFAGFLWVAAGASIYRVATDGAHQVWGSLNTVSGRVGMAHNGQVLVVADGRDGWILSPSGVPGGSTEWTPHAVTLGEYVRPTPGNATGFVYECTDVGNGYSYGPEPTWPTVTGQTVTQPNGGPTWTCRALTFTQITDPDFPVTDEVVFCNGRFVFPRPDQAGQFAVSALYAISATDFNDRLDFATSESDPDPLLRITEIANELWLVGERTVERWYPTAGDFPFAPDTGATIQRGCAARGSVATIDQLVVWLSKSREGADYEVLAASRSSDPQKLTTGGLEHRFAGYVTVEDADAYTYRRGGHSFYVISFPTANETWVYDFSTGLWHQRGKSNGAGYDRHQSAGYVRFAGKDLVAHPSLGNLYDLDPDDDTEYDGTEIVRERVLPQVHAETGFVVHRELRLDVEKADITLTLEWSDDGGVAFGPAIPLSRSMASEPRFARLGRSRGRYYRIRITGGLPKLFGAYLDARGAGK